MISNYVPSEKTAARAAMLWRRMIDNPEFDNGDNSPTGATAIMMAMMIPTDKDKERLDDFQDRLKSAILTPNANGHFPGSSLHVDYGPDQILADAAQAAGLDVQFPWKTNMWICRDYLSVRGGYSAEVQYHYLLENGKWLVTSLNGTEIDKIKQYVVNGTLPEFSVEV